MQRIYDWVVVSTYREPKVRGCGVGDIKTMLETNNMGGKCADLNGLFVGLCRASGIPARGIGWILAERLFALQFTLDPLVWVAGLICGTVLVGLSGTLATRSVINTPPIVTLRDE